MLRLICRVLLALALVALARPASAAEPTPFLLPAGEAVDPWRSALALAGFTPGPGRPGVEIIDQGERWLIVVWDASGEARAAEVARPRTPRAREELVWLAASLARGGAAPPSRPPPVPAVAAPRVERPRASGGAVAPARLSEAVTPAPGTSEPPVPSQEAPPPAALAVPPAAPASSGPTPIPAPLDVASPAPPSPMLGYMAMSAVGALRGGQEATGGVTFGWLVSRGAFWADARGIALTEAGLVALAEGDGLSTWGASMSAGWQGGPAVAAPRLGLGTTLARLRFQEEGYGPQYAWNSALHSDLGVDLAIGRGLALNLGVRLGVDLRRVVFATSGEQTAALNRLWVWPTAGLIFRGP